MNTPTVDHIDRHEFDLRSVNSMFGNLKIIESEIQSNQSFVVEEVKNQRLQSTLFEKEEL